MLTSGMVQWFWNEISKFEADVFKKVPGKHQNNKNISEAYA